MSSWTSINKWFISLLGELSYPLAGTDNGYVYICIGVRW